MDREKADENANENGVDLGHCVGCIGGLEDGQGSAARTDTFF